MEKETIYKLNDEELKSLVAFMVIKFLLASLSKDPDAMRPEKVLDEVREYLNVTRPVAA